MCNPFRLKTETSVRRPPWRLCENAAGPPEG